MSIHVKVPTLRNPNIVVRLAASSDEVREADALVYQNYVDDGFWTGDASQIETNKFLRSPRRIIFVLYDGARLIGTMSIIEDSADGLPSDGTQAALVNRLRSTGASMAEISAFAMDRAKSSQRRLFLMLISYMFQYSFYYVGIDCLIASCKPEHADFYESALGFRKVSDLTYYDYSHAAGYLISLDLIAAHRTLAERYPIDPLTENSFYRFLFEPQPCQRFAPTNQLKRSRAHNWTTVQHVA